jgi:hypothetical protein
LIRSEEEHFRSTIRGWDELPFQTYVDDLKKDHTDKLAKMSTLIDETKTKKQDNCKALETIKYASIEYKIYVEFVY